MTDPLTLFRSGMDTQDIADFFCCSEATIYSVLHAAREKEYNKAGKDERRRLYQRERHRRIRQEMREARAGT
jgi:transposase